MAHKNSSPRGGRPPRGVDRRQWHPRMSPAMATALERRAETTGIPAATYREILVSRAHGFTSDRLDEIAVPLNMSPTSDRELVSAVERISPTDFASREKGLSVRLPLKLDEPLAVEIEQVADRLGVDVSKYLRAIFRVAIGEDAHVLGTQDELDFIDQERGVRLAS